MGAGGYWAIDRLLADEVAADLEERERTEVLAVEDELSRSQTLPGFLQVEESVAIRASGDGTVTWRDSSQEITVDVGSTILEVDLMPVIAIEGDVPMFRALSEGDVGSDVLQLQRYLFTAGFLDLEPDGKYGRVTTAAVKRWREELGEDKPAGIVPAGRLVAVESLPAQLRYADAVEAGAPMQSGDSLLFTRDGDGMIVVPIPQSRLPDFEQGTRAKVLGDSAEVAAVVAGFANSDGQVAVRLEPLTGEFCDALLCGPLSSGDELPVSVEFEILSPTRGVVVPVSALRTQPDDSLAVLLDNGDIVPVVVVASDRGLAVVDGIDVGVRVIIE